MELHGPTFFALFAVSSSEYSSTATTATTATTISAVSSASGGHAYELDRLASELPLLLSTGMDSS